MSTEPPEGYVSSADACRALNISDRTLRRRVQAGTIAGEYVARPQGTILYVKLPEGHAAQQAAPHGEPRKTEEMPEENRENQAALAASLLEEVTRQQAALLAVTERAVRAEGERDAARQAAEAAEQRVTDLRRELDRERNRSWWARLWGIYPDDRT